LTDWGPAGGEEEALPLTISRHLRRYHLNASNQSTSAPKKSNDDTVRDETKLWEASIAFQKALS
jgi:hypothetical protein